MFKWNKLCAWEKIKTPKPPNQNKTPWNTLQFFFVTYLLYNIHFFLLWTSLSVWNFQETTITQLLILFLWRHTVLPSCPQFHIQLPWCQPYFFPSRYSTINYMELLPSLQLTDSKELGSARTVGPSNLHCAFMLSSLH